MDKDKIKVRQMLRDKLYNYARGMASDDQLLLAIELTLNAIDGIELLEYLDLETQLTWMYEDLRLQLLYNIQAVIEMRILQIQGNALSRAEETKAKSKIIKFTGGNER